MENKYKNLVSDWKQMLCPPGSGVFTVNTAADRKAALQGALYGQGNDPLKAWENSLENASNNKVLIMGLASDAGGGILRGANWGPLFLRSSLYENPLPSGCMDLGDVRVIPHLLHDKYLNPETMESCRNSLYGDKGSKLPVSPLSIAEKTLEDIYKENSGQRFFVIGGDHSISYATVKTYLEAKKRAGIKAAVIHFDAHTDLLEERLGIDICFGSWCTKILPYLDSPDLLIQLGIRSSGKDKEFWQNKYGVQQFWSQEIRQRGVQDVFDDIKGTLKKHGVQELYVSFDIDALDMKYASATGTPEKDGLFPHECMLLIELLAGYTPITGADLAEIAPFVHYEDGSEREPETTLLSATPLARNLINFML